MRSGRDDGWEREGRGEGESRQRENALDFGHQRIADAGRACGDRSMSGQGRPVDAASESPALPSRDEIAGSFLADEGEVVSGLAGHATATDEERPRLADLAAGLVRAARANRHQPGGVDALMHEYGPTPDEGVH